MENPDVNPLTFVAEGHRWRNQGNRHAALASYQKALTCVPMMYGVQPWFQEYLLGGHRPLPLTNGQIAAIYSSIALVLMALTRYQDARIAADAALRIDPSDRTCKKILEESSGAIAKPPASGPSSAEDDYTDTAVSIVLITHFKTNLVKYGELAPPSTNLLAATYGSLLQVLGDGVKQFPRLICYDKKRNPNGLESKYVLAVNAFARKHGFDLIEFEQAGLRTILNTIIHTVETPLVMIIEHDWLFQGPRIPLNCLLALFYKNPQIQSVRFNQRRNIIDRYDFILEAEEATSNMPLLRTSAFSNNPSLFRTSTFRDLWMPLCLRDPHYRNQDLSGTAFGIEEPLFKQHIEDIRCLGFGKSHEKWGSYVYGRFGDPARIIHLGE